MNKETLDEIATRYHTTSVPDIFIENIGQIYNLKWIGEQIQNSNSILELGYGDGIVTDYLVNQNKKLTQIEGSKILVDKAKEKYGEKIKCIHSLFEEFEPVEKFDAIVAGHVLEHVDNPVELLNKMKEWLSPEGEIVIIVPNSESIHRRLGVLMGLQPVNETLSARDKLVGHQRVYSLWTLENDINQCDMKIVVSRGLGFKPVPNSLMLNFDHKLIKAFNDISESMPIEMSSNLGVVAVKKGEFDV